MTYSYKNIRWETECESARLHHTNWLLHVVFSVTCKHIIQLYYSAILGITDISHGTDFIVISLQALILCDIIW